MIPTRSYPFMYVVRKWFHPFQQILKKTPSPHWQTFSGPNLFRRLAGFSRIQNAVKDMCLRETEETDSKQGRWKSGVREWLQFKFDPS